MRQENVSMSKKSERKRCGSSLAPKVWREGETFRSAGNGRLDFIREPASYWIFVFVFVPISSLFALSFRPVIFSSWSVLVSIVMCGLYCVRGLRVSSLCHVARCQGQLVTMYGFHRVGVVDFLPSLFLLYLSSSFSPSFPPGQLVSFVCLPDFSLTLAICAVSSFFIDLPQAFVFSFFLGLFCHCHLSLVSFFLGLFATGIWVSFFLCLFQRLFCGF